MTSLVEAVAGGIDRMNLDQLAQLLARVAPALEVRLVSHNAETHAVVPRALSESMFYAIRHDSWTEMNARRVLQEHWRKALAASEREP